MDDTDGAGDDMELGDSLNDSQNSGNSYYIMYVLYSMVVLI